MIDTDKDWEAFAQKDAYHSVLTHPDYEQAHGNPGAKKRFFESGEAHVMSVLHHLEQFNASSPASWDVLDFGCGVGRLLVPFAMRCTYAHGVDISESMRKEARKNLLDSNCANATVSDLSDMDGKVRFDLIHSFIVFQHIPMERGLQLTRELVAKLKPGGMVALHYTFARDYAHSESGWKVASRYPSLIPLLRLMKLENPFKRRMLMVRYDLNAVIHLLYKLNVGCLGVEVVDEGGDLGAMIYGQLGA